MSRSAYVTLPKSELIAIQIALDELVSYLDVVEEVADDDPPGKLRWACGKLRGLLQRYGVEA